MSTLLVVVLASAHLSFTSDLTYSAGISPGNTVGLALGTRFTYGRVSLGVEAQFITPGSHLVADRDVTGNVQRQTTVWGSQGVGLVGHVPLCVRFGPLSTCGVASVGGVSLRAYGSPRGGEWHPLVSAGIRLAGEFPEQSSVRFRASAQVLGGIVRPTDGFWAASPVQLGLTLGVVFDAI